MDQVKTTDDIKRLGTILGIWAHPDDETYSMGGIMAAAVENGQTVVCITATRGELGIQDESRWPAKRLGQIREQELKHAFKILGVERHHWLDYPDGGCDKVDENEAVNRICSLIVAFKPDSILTFGADGLTGHPDHQTVSGWAVKARDMAESHAKIYYLTQTHAQYEALQEADKRFNIFFNTDQPPVCVPGKCSIRLELNDELYDLKLKALYAMPSQTEGMLKIFGNSLRISFGTEAFVELK